MIRCRIFPLGLVALLWATASYAGDDLPAKVDSLIQAAAKGQAFAPVCDDATFARRVYLDFAGRIPTIAEFTAFASDSSPSKRTQLIDRLIASPEFPRHWANVLNTMLMERRGEHAEWTKFLIASCEQNKPWDQLAREILAPDSTNEAIRVAAFFHTKRLDKVGQQETDYPGLTRDVGRLFLGMDLQCAQCHNHLFIESYKQLDFQGLYTVYQNTFIRTDVSFPAIGQKVMNKKLDFSSVFDKVPMATGPRIPGGQEVSIVTFDKGQEFAEAPDRAKNFLGTPKFQPLQAVANQIASPDNKAFARNIANRLWFVLMGRGLVNPLDQHHTANPPTHPDVLDLLSQEVVARKFDLKSLLRDLALTQTYQRSTRIADPIPPSTPDNFRAAVVRRLSAEQLLSSLLVATGTSDAAKPIPPEDKRRMAFLKAFANVPQDPEIEFTPSLRSSLFLLNDASVLECLTPTTGNLLDRVVKTAEAKSAAQELYRAILCREPTDEELAAFSEYVGKNEMRRSAALVNWAWSLVASTEFCLNH